MNCLILAMQIHEGTRTERYCSFCLWLGLATCGGWLWVCVCVISTEQRIITRNYMHPWSNKILWHSNYGILEMFYARGANFLLPSSPPPSCQCYCRLADYFSGLFFQSKNELMCIFSESGWSGSHGWRWRYFRGFESGSFVPPFRFIENGMSFRFLSRPILRYYVLQFSIRFIHHGG